MEKQGESIVGSGVLAAATVKSSIFWDMTPCSPTEIHRLFGGMYCLRLQGQE
jgi:hypothetical protein